MKLNSILAVMALLGLILMSGVVPENPNALIQGIAAFALISPAAVSGIWTEIEKAKRR